MRLFLRRAYSGLLDWMLHAGMVRAVLAIVAFSVVLSVIITGLAISLFLPGTRLEEWLYFSIAAPLLISPMVAIVIMSLAYRLVAAQAALTEMAETDPLTGVGNRRRFFDIAGRDFERSRREQTPLSVVLLDIDHFKSLNDRYGHAAGDAALAHLAQCCRDRLRQTDLICRWGGEEFIVVLPQTPLSGALLVAEDLRTRIDAMTIPGIPDGVSVSIGVAEISEAAASLDEAIAVADRHLYEAKAGGRNRVMPPLAA